jgi:hypothetical protein
MTLSRGQDPQDRLDWAFDWAKWLTDGETISTATVTTAPAGLTLTSDIGTTKVTVWVSGGTVGTRYAVTCHITTNQGRQAERTRYIDIKEQ